LVLVRHGLIEIVEYACEDMLPEGLVALFEGEGIH
jgi:hypothetical protein